MRILRFSILAKILGYYLKSPKSRFSPALKSDFLLEGWAEFLQGVFLGTKEALCKISAKSSNKKLENWHPKNHDFRTFFKNPSIWPISENFKKCPFFVAISIFYPRIPPKSSLLANFTPFMSTWVLKNPFWRISYARTYKPHLLAGFWDWIHCRRPNFKFLRNTSRST